MVVLDENKMENYSDNLADIFDNFNYFSKFDNSSQMVVFKSVVLTKDSFGSGECLEYKSGNHSKMRQTSKIVRGKKCF